MEPPVRQPQLGYKAPVPAASAAAGKQSINAPAQPVPMRAPEQRPAQASAVLSGDDDDDMPPLIYRGSESSAPPSSQSPPPRSASAGPSSPPPQSAPVAQPATPQSSHSLAQPSMGAADLGNARDNDDDDDGHGHSHGGSHGHSRGGGEGGGLLTSVLGVFGIGEGAHNHGKHGGEEGGESKDWDGRYKYEVAQTLAARMRGAQLKPELAELHMSVDPWTAVQSGSLEHLDVALSASVSFDLDALDKKGLSLLHYAAKRPHLSLVRMLVSRGANVNRVSTSEIKERPLQSAIEGGDLSVVDFLVLQGADMHAVNYKAQ